jgi:hypothetical protein
MNYEKIAWWIFWLAFGLVIFLLLYGLALAIFSSTPIELTYLLGVVSFGLFANKLLFGYGWVANILDNVISNEEIKDEVVNSAKDRLDKQNIQPREAIDYLSFSALITLILKDLDYYKYAYYGIFMLLALLTLLTKFNLLGNLIVGKYLEGLFWGAATTTFFVWGLEQLAKVSFSEFLNMNLKEITEKERI